MVVGAIVGGCRCYGENLGEEEGWTQMRPADRWTKACRSLCMLLQCDCAYPVDALIDANFFVILAVLFYPHSFSWHILFFCLDSYFKFLYAFSWKKKKTILCVYVLRTIVKYTWETWKINPSCIQVQDSSEKLETTAKIHFKYPN